MGRQRKKRADAAIVGKMDAYANLTNMFGTSLDPYVNTNFANGTVFTQQQLEAYYRYDWMARKVIEIYPEDALREWIDFKTDDDALAEAVMDKLKQLKVKEKVVEAAIWGRLYGGALIILGAVDGGNPEEELKDKIDSFDFLTVIDRWQAEIASYQDDPMKPGFGEPLTYRIHPRNTTKGATGAIIHASRVIKFDGVMISETDRIANSGWNDSVLVSIQDALKPFGVSLQAGAQLFTDFITKVLKMDGLSDLMGTTEGRNAIALRIRAAIANMSNKGIVVIEGKAGLNEDFTKIQTPITGFVELLSIYIDIMSGAANVPKTRLFGQSIGTTRAGADEDTRSYYDQVKNYQETDIRPALERICRLVMLSMKKADKWAIEFNSLWQMSDKEKAEVRKMMAEADQKYFDMGVVTAEEIGLSRFSPDGYSVETSLNFEARGEMEEDREEPEE